MTRLRQTTSPCLLVFTRTSEVITQLFPGYLPPHVFFNPCNSAVLVFFCFNSTKHLWFFVSSPFPRHTQHPVSEEHWDTQGCLTWAVEGPHPHTFALNNFSIFITFCWSVFVCILQFSLWTCSSDTLLPGLQTYSKSICLLRHKLVMFKIIPEVWLGEKTYFCHCQAHFLLPICLPFVYLSSLWVS